MLYDIETETEQLEFDTISCSLQGETRRAPKVGYDNGPKNEYRQKLWSYFIEAKKLIQNPGDKILIMPSKEGIEIEVALDHGLRPEDILCVDQSAALIANSPWRKTHPEISFMACDVADAPARAKKRGWNIVAANLDLCGNLSRPTINVVKKFWEQVNDSDEFYLALTIAKGREAPEIALLVNEIPAGKYKSPRMMAMVKLSGIGRESNRDVTPIVEDEYRAGRIVMIWAALHCKNNTKAVAREKAERAIQQELFSILRRQSLSEGVAYYHQHKEVLDRLYEPPFSTLLLRLFMEMVQHGYTPPEKRNYLFATEALFEKNEFGISWSDAAACRALDHWSIEDEHGRSIFSKSFLRGLIISKAISDVNRGLDEPDLSGAYFTCSIERSATPLPEREIDSLKRRLRWGYKYLIDEAYELLDADAQFQPKEWA